VCSLYLLLILGIDSLHGLVPRLEVLAKDLGDWFLAQILGLEKTCTSAPVHVSRQRLLSDRTRVD